ncbi:MAG: MFS transporter [Dehalococcoidia bacterium]
MATAATAYAGVRDVLTGKRQIYYGWRVLLVGTIAMALGSGLSMSSFGLYVHPLEDEFGWNRADVSVAYSVAILTGGLVGPFIGHWVDAHGARLCIVVGGCLAACSYILLAMTQELWQFYVFYGIHAVFRQMMFFLPFQSLISQWFERRRGVALSILGSGFSIGGFVVLPIVAVAIGGLGWRGAFLFSGVVLGIFYLLAGIFVLRNRPADVGELIDGNREPEAGVPARSASRNAEGMTLREAMRTPQFWLCAVGFMLLFFGMIGWMAHQVPFYESVGMSRATATFIVSMIAGLGVLSRLSIGLIADHFDRFELVVVALLGTLMLGMVTLLISTHPVAIGIFIICWVIGSSMGPLAESIVLIKAFGLRHFGSILGAVLVVETSGEVLSPSIAGIIYDRTGSYDGALVMFGAAFALGMVLFVIAARMQTPMNYRHAQEA